MSTNDLTSQEKSELSAAWSAAAEKQYDQQTKALFGEVNIRLNVASALKAVWTTAKICFKAKKAALTGMLGPEEIMGIGADVFGVIVSGLNAIRETLLPLEYAASVVLSSFPEGATSDEFDKRLREFLETGKGVDLPWYLGMSKGNLQSALEDLKQDGRFAELVRDLKEKDLITEEKGQLTFKPRHFTWGFSQT
jgi:hypothetical protein